MYLSAWHSLLLFKVQTIMGTLGPGDFMMTSQGWVRSSLPSRLLMLLFLPLHTQKRRNETEEILYYKECASWVSSGFSVKNILPLLLTLPLCSLNSVARWNICLEEWGLAQKLWFRIWVLTVGFNCFGKVHAVSFSDRGSEPERIFL